MRRVTEAESILSTALARNLEMALTASDIERIRIGESCHYCGGELKHGVPCLDRIDNARGYRADNVVPCCSTCNWARGGLLTYEEFCAAMRVRLKRNGWGKAWPERIVLTGNGGRTIVRRRPSKVVAVGKVIMANTRKAADKSEREKLTRQIGGVFAARRMARKRAKSRTMNVPREHNKSNELRDARTHDESVIDSCTYVVS